MRGKNIKAKKEEKMKIRSAKVVVLIFVFAFCSILSTTGWALTKIEDYENIYSSIKTLEGALEKALNASVTSAYIPSIGCVIICNPFFTNELGNLNIKACKLVEALGPLVQIKDNESICVIIKYSGFIKGEQEYVIIAPKKTATDVETWQIFSTEG